MHIRPATAGDAAGISALILSVSRFFTLHPDGEGAEAFLANLSPQAIGGYLVSPAFAYQVAEEDGALAGVVAIRDNAHLHHLFVAAAHHGRGLARQLWDAAREAALRAGNPGEFTVNSSIYAIPVYERFGFVPTGPRVEQNGIAFLPMKLVLGE
ncbi:GNAT family N-acetyltransferase [Longimicrobium sp.]|uniref:GNAT family N-acetyltransferase n=1 Tax=Longimicrobium sp. TaxID=2029185 RepID=UPI003B3BA4AF